MRIIDSSCHRGTSTILGTIIFIGIMFTAVIPMMLVMRQADTLHDITKHEVEVLDDESTREILGLYVYPASLSSPNVNVKIVNNGEVLSHVVKIWINDESRSVDINILSMSEEEQVIDDFSWVVGEDYDIRVTTDRGNVFLSENGILHYDENGHWEMETFTIRIFTSGFTWFLRIKIWMGVDTTGTLIYDKWEFVGGSYEIIVPERGNYYVGITKWGQTTYHDVYIPWPDGDPWDWVFA